MKNLWPSVLKEDSETTQCVLFDITLGRNIATRVQKRHGTWVFFESKSETFCILTQNNVGSYFRIYKGREPQRVMARGKTLMDVLPQFYLFFRHIRGDQGYEKRNRLFNRTQEVIDRYFANRDQTDFQVTVLMKNIGYEDER